MTKNIVVTGGAGFIGRWLCKKLLENGHLVCCVDNLQTSSIENIKELRTNPNFRFYMTNAKDINTMPEEYTFFKTVDQVYHLACPASPVHYQAFPITTLETCFIGTQNVIRYALKNNARMVYTSTSEVYGDPLIETQSEDYYGNVNCRSKRACYDEGKRIGETLCTEYVRKYKADIRVARIFNTYGPYLARGDGRVVSNFIVQALSCNPITVYGDGSQTRSFCYVDDTVEGLIKLMETDDDDLKYISVNIGNPEERTILSFAHDIKKITNSESDITFQPLPEADPKQRKPDIDLALNKLKWYPKTTYEEGLSKTIEFFK